MRITIDIPIIQSSDDCLVYLQGPPYNNWLLGTIQTVIFVGNDDPYYYKWGGGFRFQNIQIPQGAEIYEAHITFTALNSDSGTTINSRLTGEDVDNADAFSTIADYQNRRGTDVDGPTDNFLTSAQVAWDSIAAWTANATYDSPDIKTIIQEIVDRPGWVNGNSLVIFWDDHEARSTIGNDKWRRGKTFDTGSGIPVLHIEFEGTIPPQTTKNQVNLVIKNQDGDTLAYLPTAHQTGYDYRINELGQLNFKVPAGDPNAGYLKYPNEAWLYKDGVLKDIFIVTSLDKTR